MAIRKLYVLSDYEPSALSQQLVESSVPFSSETTLTSIHADQVSTNWFDWNETACILLEPSTAKVCQQAIAYLRSVWISAPLILIAPPEMFRDAILPHGVFRLLPPTNDISSVVAQIEAAFKHDNLGEPSPAELRLRYGRLGNQERRVLNMSLTGMTSKEIGELIGIRYQTVDKYRRNALCRMKSKNVIVLLNQLFQTITPGAIPQSSVAPL